jgi:4-hydroxy-tetrahydrodipicolinate reductase
LRLVAEALSLSVDSVEASGGFAAATRAIHIAAGVIQPGTVAAQQTTVSCMRRGKPLISLTATWYCGTDIDTDWDLGETGWRVVVEGDTPLDVRIRFPVPAERWAAVSPGLTAHRAVNAVPYVCAAPPGICTTVDLPQIIAELG